MEMCIACFGRIGILGSGRRVGGQECHQDCPTSRIPESIIGLTIVALGTSLPELATSVMAAYKHNSDIALGNVVGSNIFNVFFILGTSALIKPLPAYQGVELDTVLVALSGAIVWLLLICNKKRTINRWGGALLLTIYAVYLSFRLGVI